MGYFRFCHYWVVTCLHSIDHWYRLSAETLADAAISVSFFLYIPHPSETEPSYTIIVFARRR